MATSNNDLFSIDKIAHREGFVSATININANSEILKGHFPDHPVVPGACMLQIVKEALENALKKTLRLRKADQLKFMSIIDPTNIPAVQLEISYKEMEDGDISSTAKLCNPETIFFKFQGSFITQ